MNQYPEVSRYRFAVVLGLLLALLSGCVYYNTFFNAKKAFDEAETQRHQAEQNSAGRAVRVGGSNYQKAIEKSLKVIENYPNSKYYDDALHVLMVSYYHTEAYSKCERRAREILANYPESDFVRDAYLYMGKAKLQLGDQADAMAVFEEVFTGEYDEDFKAQAATALGTFYFEDKRYDEARPYLLAVRDSLGNDVERRMVQRMLTEAEFSSFKFAEAKSAALQLLGMDPERTDLYYSLLIAARCSFQLLQFIEGHDYLSRMREEEVFFDSMSSIDLMAARGYEDEDDIDQAESMYRKVIEETVNLQNKSQAFWRLGLIHQFDYDDLVVAKEYYDSTARLSHSSEIGQEALQRSSDIGKLEEFNRTVTIDSTSTQAVIDEAAYVQYQLAELYWFKLNKPDTAIMEMQYVVDSFPTAYDAPKAIISLSQMTADYEGDSTAARTMLQDMLRRYPNSDYAPVALELLGLKGTAADTGYAEVYVRRAEDFLIDSANVDSALYYYQYVVDYFPDSKYQLHSRFAKVWVTENYNSPGDSSVILAYNELVDSFPGSHWASVAAQRTAYRPSSSSGGEEYVEGDSTTGGPGSPGGEGTEGGATEDTTTYDDPMTAVYTGPDGTKIYDLMLEPIRVEEPFVYPPEAYREDWEGPLYFQVSLDFSGEVTDYRLIYKSPHEEIDRRAEEHVASMAFDASQIPTDLLGQWLVFKFWVTLPDHLR